MGSSGVLLLLLLLLPLLLFLLLLLLLLLPLLPLLLCCSCAVPAVPVAPFHDIASNFVFLEPRRVYAAEFHSSEKADVLQLQVTAASLQLQTLASTCKALPNW